MKNLGAFIDYTLILYVTWILILAPFRIYNSDMMHMMCKPFSSAYAPSYMLFSDQLLLVEIVSSIFQSIQTTFSILAVCRYIWGKTES